MFSTEVRHSGTIVSVRGDVAEVRFHDTAKEGCAGCGLSSFCGGVTLVEASLPVRLAGSVDVGTTVLVRSHGGAVMRLVVLPLTVFVLVLVVALQFGATEVLAAVLALVAVALVFVAVHYQSRRRGLEWTIVEIEER